MFKLVKFNFFSPKKLQQDTILNFSLAEFSSAIEMLQASKLVNDPKLCMGFIQHSLDEYKHTKYFLKLLNETNSFEKYDLRFSSIQCYQNGFLNNYNYLFEKMSLKQFSVFIGVNEKLALKLFTKLKKYIPSYSKSLREELNSLIEEEKEHLNNINIQKFEITYNDLLSDEARHSILALKFAKKHLSKKSFQIQFWKFYLLNKIRHLFLGNVFLKKQLSFAITFLMIIFIFPFYKNLLITKVKNDFSLKKSDARLIL